MQKKRVGPMLNQSLDHKVPGCDHFKWREVLFLPQWNIYAVPRYDGIIENLCKVTFALDKIRKKLGKPITVTSGFRPEPYNKLIGGAQKSAHMDGMALDFIIIGMETRAARDYLRHKLFELGIRMENADTPHIHIDIRCDDDDTNEKRFFIP